MKNILFVSSEAVPFMKTGGLADVVGSLPRYINKNEFDVRVILPKYACMDKSFLPDLKFKCYFYVDLNWRRQYAGIFETQYKGITYYFVDNEFYFAGTSPYNNIYEDVEKFAYFSKAVLCALPFLEYHPDVIHCNDWQTGLLPVFLHTSFGSDLFYSGIKTVFSIHNLKFQGRWRIQEVMDITGLPKQIFNSNELEAYGEANYLKGGVVYADAVTTVSPTYAHDITTPEGGEGLDGLMFARRNVLSGIINGLDYEEYNPLTDPYIDYHFSERDAVEGKRLNKKKFQETAGISVDENAMLIGIISRLTDQKGFDLIAYVMDELCQEDVQIVVLGTGEEKYENMFRHFDWKYNNKVSANIYYSDALSHKIYAASDAFLMPSLFEPCGLSQLMALHYGTLPIVRETGGLKDTVEPYNEYESTGTGFSFSNYNAYEMLATIRYAKYVFYQRKREWNKMVDRAMAADFSWSVSAAKYQEMYDWLIG